MSFSIKLKLDAYTLVILPGHYIIAGKNELAIIETGDFIISSEDISYAETEELAADASVLERDGNMLIRMVLRIRDIRIIRR